ncbi:hypothetical protein BCT19_20040 [Vibrio splendidus]|uniref:JmjC domain-containing protein n=1 Tax=Vibrio splendidus TaxID=29497 RepID=UPI000C832592|nr:cupin domain-containing protein [Vibrio splendidus]PMO02238.1 hypothetical protein BCT19_20040 [Vibrio splendidus]
MSFTELEQEFLESLMVDDVICNEVKLLQGSGSVDFFNLEEIEAMLSGSRITSDRVRFYRDKHNLSNSIFLLGKNKDGQQSYYLRNDKLNNALLKGGTLALDSIDEYFGYFSETTNKISTLLKCESSANLYVSYGNSSGFGEHSDDHHVLVKQLVGKKRWMFEGGTKSIVLQEGDLLFVPKGILHDPVAETSRSLHVTYSIVRPTLNDFIDWAIKNKENYNTSNFDIGDKGYFLELHKIMADFILHRDNKARAIRHYKETRMFPK